MGGATNGRIVVGIRKMMLMFRLANYQTGLPAN